MILLPRVSQQQDLKLKSVHLEFRVSLITCTLCILSQTGLCVLIVVYTKVKIKVPMFTGPEWCVSCVTAHLKLQDLFKYILELLKFILYR